MRLRIWLGTIVVSALCTAAASGQGLLVVENVNVVPMDSERVLEGQSVVVRDGRIERIAVTGEVTTPDGAEVIDGSGLYLMPGLAEMHAHVPDDPAAVEEVLFLYVANGVTTARGMLGVPDHLELRQRLERHEVLGPRLYTSGPSLSGNSVDGPASARRLVMQQAQAGYDFVKLHPGLSRPAFDAAVETADDAGIDLAGHVSADVGLMGALDAGQATIDHLDGYVEYLAGAAAGESGFFGLGVAARTDLARIPEAVQATVEAGVYNVPTQTLLLHWAAPSPTVDELLAREEMAYVSEATRRQWAQSKRQLTGGADYDAAAAAALIEMRRTLVKALHDAGAGLLLGSDAPQVFNVPGFSIHHELTEIVAAGLTPYEALRTGTVAPAEFLAAEAQFGRIVPGLEADFILVEGNPLERVEVLRRPAGVMVRGRWLDRAALDAGLDRIAGRYR